MNTNKTSDEAKQRAKNYMSLKGALEPNQIKCYCGHTSYCDCGPLDEAKKETLEEAAEKYLNEKYQKGSYLGNLFIAGAKYQAERMYSEDDLREAFKQSRNAFIFEKDMPPVYESFEDWFEQFKKK